VRAAFQEYALWTSLVIRYTLDGSEVNSSSAVYTEPIVVRDTLR
jgi:hypothetical protein